MKREEVKRLSEREVSLWDISIPGRDTREGELTMVPDELKGVLSTESLDKLMHAGVFAYSVSCYLLDIFEELYGIEDEEKQDKLKSLCFNRVVQDLIFGAQGSYVHDFDDEDHHTNAMIDWITGVFEEAKKKI